MKNIIIHPEKDPLGTMMLDYLAGDRSAYAQVESPTLDMWQMRAETMFRTFKTMNRIERKALSLCKGKILDVGAGSGCHSLYLQKKHTDVHAIDISPGCVSAMKKRKVANVSHTNVFSLQDYPYDTILMLMNGIGICQDLEGLNLFFQFIKTLLAPGGQILADSTDLCVLYPEDMLQTESEGYYGETQFVMTYKKSTSDPFGWLYIDFDTLSYYADFHGFSCENIISDFTGKYLARIKRHSNSK